MSTFVNFFSVDWPAPPLQLSSTFAPFHPVGNFHQNIWDTLNNHLTSTLQDPVTRSSCLDFYQLVLFFTTAGAAVLRAVGVQLLIFVKAVKRNEKEGRPIKAGSKWTAILLHVNHIWMSILDQNKLYNVLLCCNQDSLHCIMSSSWLKTHLFKIFYSLSLGVTSFTRSAVFWTLFKKSFYVNFMLPKGL